MTDVKRLKPRPVYYTAELPRQTPQCSMPATNLHPQRGAGDMEWRRKHYGKRGHDPNFCVKSQVAMMPNGKGYCSFHAGQIALAILLGEEPDYGEALE